jgi:RHS repeat-associated protein
LKADGVTEEWTFYGARGERLGVYSLGVSGGFTPLRTNVAFAGTLILDTNSAAFNDRTGSNRASNSRFYPYGDEIASTANDREKFGTYLRDGFTGLDYADQRYYASTYGRFSTADPATSSAGPSDPVSWNRYSYTGGDPINRLDPRGTDWEYDFLTGDWNVYYEWDEGSLPGPADQMGCLENPVACAMAYWAVYGAEAPGIGGPATPAPAPSQPAKTCDPGFLPSGSLYPGSDGLVFSGADIDFGARAVYGETSGNLQEDSAIASVIDNRLQNPLFAGGALTTLTQVVTAPGQFAAVTPSPGNVPFVQSQPGLYENLSPAACQSLASAITAMVSTVDYGPSYQYTSFRTAGSTSHAGTIIGGNIFWIDSPPQPPTRRPTGPVRRGLVK